MTDARVIDTGITPETGVIANRLNYDGIAILQQGSLRAIRRSFEKLENPDKFIEDPTALISPTKIDDSYSINSVSFFVRFMIGLLIFAVVWDYLNTK